MTHLFLLLLSTSEICFQNRLLPPKSCQKYINGVQLRAASMNFPKQTLRKWVHIHTRSKPLYVLFLSQEEIVVKSQAGPPTFTLFAQNIHMQIFMFQLLLSCLENPIDRGAWQAEVHGVVKSQTRVSNFIFTFHFHALEKEMATQSSVLAWRIQGPGSLVGCHLWGRTESDTTEVSQQQQLLFRHLVRSDFFPLHGLQCTRLHCPSLSPGVCSQSCSLSL